jgi:hypothetical protein
VPRHNATSLARLAVHDKIESQVKIAQAKLETLKAKAEAPKANAEVKVIANLLTKKLAIDLKFNELRKSGDETYEQIKTDAETRVRELEKSVPAIEFQVQGCIGSQKKET